jgi:hypothetical protein
VVKATDSDSFLAALESELALLSLLLLLVLWPKLQREL